ncbi:tigger transposable element-derived protein 4-like, partial [Ctenocephalides felis]|uniref:tigger transposable element-derived protein 4-like n=1 Tax=Ctenocephalides felis TaxID=7515 RepID=UPI000E6E59A4
KIVGESLSGDENSTTNWLTSVWPNLREQFSDGDIFNADETGLFYKLMPERTLKFKGENCSGGKLTKDRITLVVAANMSGTEKKKLLIIGLDDVGNFEKWIRDWDRDLVKKNRKILLLVVNCPAHPNIADLKSITLAFFPPNTTSILQPMDQGIIRSLQTNFRKKLVLKMIQCVDDNEDLSSKITVLDAILMVNDAWNKLQQNTIHNCFRHSGLNKSHDDSSFQISENEFVEEDVPLSLLLRNRNIDLATTPEMWEEYVDIDNTLITCEELTDENIIQNINDNELFGSDEEEEVDDKLPTAEEALKAAELLSKFVSSNIENENVTNAMSFVHNSQNNGNIISSDDESVSPPKKKKPEDDMDKMLKIQL